MIKRPPARKQPTSQEMVDDILGLIQRKFYAGEGVEFAKDRRRLLQWAVLWPASWLEERHVTIPVDRYKKLLDVILIEAAAMGNTGAIKYRPAWLGKVVQSHFAVHGDEIYEEAKNVRTLADNALMLAGKSVGRAPDVIQELATANRLLKGKKKVARTVVKDQLTLL